MVILSSAAATVSTTNNAQSPLPFASSADDSISVVEDTCMAVAGNMEAVIRTLSTVLQNIADSLAGSAPNVCHSAATWDMSSIQSKQTLILALGSISFAAILVWYLRGKREKEKRKSQDEVKKELEALVVQEEPEKTKLIEKVEEDRVPAGRDVVDPVETESKPESLTAADDKVVEAEKEEPEEIVDTPTVITPEVEEETSEPETVTFESTQKSNSHLEQEQEPETTADTKEQEKVEEQLDVAEEKQQQEIEIPAESEEEVKQEEVEEVVILKQTNMDAAEREPTTTAETEKIPEEPTPTTVPLCLDILDIETPHNFSWSEEMEKSYVVPSKFELSSDMEPSPMPEQTVTLGKKTNKNRKNRGSTGSAGGAADQKGKKANNSPKPTTTATTNNGTGKQQQAKKQKKAPREEHQDEVGSSSNGVVVINDDANEVVGYEQSESPGLASQNSEVSSQDSGRATGGLASSLSPMEDGINGMNGIDESMLNIYEFEIPNTLVGLIIGVKGKTVKELSTRTNVRMMIREHHQPDKVKTYQICQVRGKREEINRCLCMLRNRFPTERFPELNLQPVIPPPVPNNFFDMIQTQPTWLTLPEDVPCEVAIASIIDASHFFLQQPTHPSFASLNLLDMYMFRLYNDNSQIPELPIPRQNGLLCAAPIANSWFRAVVVHYYEETDEVLVRFVDYGGYSQLPRRDLRQIRTDLMALPFQATEVILANVRPVDGTTQWADRAMDEMRMLCTGKVITAKLVGYEVESRIPMVELYIPVHDMDGNSQKVICFDTYLMDKGYARTADPSKMVKVSPSTASIASTVRPSLSSHPSQTLQAV